MEDGLDLITSVYKFVTPVLIGVVGYFLKGILSTIRKIEQDLARFREEYAGHRAVLQEHKERLDKLEHKLEQNDRDLKIFYMEYASQTKKTQ